MKRFELLDDPNGKRGKATVIARLTKAGKG
jgi:hypothetical protein